MRRRPETGRAAPPTASAVQLEVTCTNYVRAIPAFYLIASASCVPEVPLLPSVHFSTPPRRPRLACAWRLAARSRWRVTYSTRIRLDSKIRTLAQKGYMGLRSSTRTRTVTVRHKNCGTLQRHSDKRATSKYYNYLASSSLGLCTLTFCNVS